nr:probable aspartyl protease At4g16563 [Tanacetum cinerariifolium]
STTTHSSHRFLNHHRQVLVALSPGSDYTMSISLGASQLPVTLYIDTGSDLVWVPCKPLTCIMCEGKSDPQTTPLPHDIPVNSSSALPVTCQSRACSSVHNHVPSSHLCAMSRCPLDSIEMSEFQNYTCPSFYYAYGDDNFVGKLYEDVLELPMSAPQWLEAVTVGKNIITAPLNMSTIDGKGNGGMVVDSGTTYSMLPKTCMI